mmetsp:Transcript_24473/g.37182  ORF Transcript_24473/g.37182 Transcript_24473/m.37182 type:complete len:83 (+) Transcript_24473:369-617(+)
MRTEVEAGDDRVDPAVVTIGTAHHGVDQDPLTVEVARLLEWECLARTAALSLLLALWDHQGDRPAAAFLLPHRPQPFAVIHL